MAYGSVCITMMREDEKMPEKNYWDVVFLIVLGFFMTKDSKVEHLNSKKFGCWTLRKSSREGWLTVCFIIGQLCIDLAFEVGINF